MPILFTSESVSEGHPDKIADQVSDAVLDAILKQDPDARVACETLVTTGLVVLAGELKTDAQVDFQKVVRDTIEKIGYSSDEYMFNSSSCSVLNALHKQSPDISRGVDKQGKESDIGAGDQGMMFGYATNETPEYMPAALAFSHRIVKTLAEIRKHEPELMPYLRPDAKSQVTVSYDENGKIGKVHTVVVSTQHDEFIQPEDHTSEAIADAEEKMLQKIREDVIQHVIQRAIPEELLSEETIYHVNPTGKFVIGGPHGDAGLTGRKIIVDTYGGKGAHGGGAFSGKDSSKVDRSAAYAARHIAKNIVAAGIAEEVLVQLAYAIGVAEPVSININTYGTARVHMTDAEIAEKISKLYSFTPAAIIDRLGLRNPIFSSSAAYGHMGRESYEEEVDTNYMVSEHNNGNTIGFVRANSKKKVRFFSWEELNLVPNLQKEFKIEAVAQTS